MDEKVRELYTALHDDMAFFGKTCFGSAFTAAVPKFHQEIYKNLTNEKLRRLLIASFRGSSKSTIC